MCFSNEMRNGMIWLSDDSAVQCAQITNLFRGLKIPFGQGDFTIDDDDDDDHIAHKQSG